MTYKALPNTPEVTDLVAQWWFGAWGPGEEGKTPASIAASLSAALEQSGLPQHVGAFSGRDLVGVAALKEHELEALFPGLHKWLGNVFVAPRARGHGIAARLVGEIEELARSRGIERLYLQTVRLDGGLYGRLGWQAREEVERRGERVLVMQRNLGAPRRV